MVTCNLLATSILQPSTQSPKYCTSRVKQSRFRWHTRRRRILDSNPHLRGKLSLWWSGAGWNPCDQAGHVPSTATEKWVQTASCHSAPTPHRGLKTPPFQRILRNVENELHELNWIFKNTGFRFKQKLEMTKKILYKCSRLLAFIIFKCFTRRLILSVKSISSSLTGIKACTLLKCTTCATICRRARCRGIGLFARRAAGSGPLKGWVPSLNKAWEMPARPRVTNGWRETWTCYHEGNQIK